MELTVAALALAAGFFLLARGADALVEGGATLARRWGVSNWVVGLTVVAWGTSVPEIVVSALASAEGRPGYALGNIVGSNIANIGLVLGATGLVLPRVLAGRIGWIDAAMVLAGIGGLWYALSDRYLSRLEAGGLLGVFCLYTVSIFRRTHVTSDDPGAPQAQRPWLAVLFGCIAIIGGARAVLYGAYEVAAIFELTDGIVGLLLLAVGTSLPELAAGISSARKGHAEIGLGNVVGSNLFNTFAVSGIAGLVRPFGDGGAADSVWTRDSGYALEIDLPVNLAASVVLLALPWLGQGRLKALALLLGYIAFAVSLAGRVSS
ncbi:MAG: sodium:calcium antiporter [Planctomycetota bacterium]